MFGWSRRMREWKCSRYLAKSVLPGWAGGSGIPMPELRICSHSDGIAMLTPRQVERPNLWDSNLPDLTIEIGQVGQNGQKLKRISFRRQ